MKNRRQKALALLVAAEQELAKFRERPQFTTLSQACEKTWVAMTLFIEIKSGKNIKNGATMRKEAKQLGYEGLYSRCRILHIFHYEGSVALGFNEMAEEVEELIPEVRRELEGGR